jgi:hypothetical protein
MRTAAATQTLTYPCPDLLQQVIGDALRVAPRPGKRTLTSFARLGRVYWCRATEGNKPGRGDERSFYVNAAVERALERRLGIRRDDAG